jgi:hypothetical protein
MDGNRDAAPLGLAGNWNDDRVRAVHFVTWLDGWPAAYLSNFRQEKANAAGQRWPCFFSREL